MIIVQEDRIGAAPDGVIAWGLIVCAGLLCRLNDGRMIGAHFTTYTEFDEIQAALRSMRAMVVPPSSLSAVYLILPYEAWPRRKDEPRSGREGLTAMVRRELHFSGRIQCVNAATIPGQGDAVDIMMLPLQGAAPNPLDFILYRRRQRQAGEETRVVDQKQTYTYEIGRRTHGGYVPINMIPSREPQGPPAGFTPFVAAMIKDS